MQSLWPEFSNVYYLQSVDSTPDFSQLILIFISRTFIIYNQLIMYVIIRHKSSKLRGVVWNSWLCSQLIILNNWPIRVLRWIHLDCSFWDVNYPNRLIFAVFELPLLFSATQSKSWVILLCKERFHCYSSVGVIFVCVMLLMNVKICC